MNKTPVTSEELTAFIELQRATRAAMLPTLAVGDAVVLVLDNGNQQSAIVTHFSLKNESHRYAHFAWKTAPRNIETLALHSCKWADRVLAVFPKDCKFLAV